MNNRQGRMGNHPEDGLLADGSLSDQGVAVLMGAQGVQAVVDVHRLEAVQADGPVEFLQYAVQVAGDVIAPVGDVAGVQAPANFETPVFCKKPSSEKCYLTFSPTNGMLTVCSKMYKLVTALRLPRAACCCSWDPAPLRR